MTDRPESEDSAARTQAAPAPGARAETPTSPPSPATSTGGMTNKKWGRVGDAPIIGAGTWADERCGVSGTGWGEFYLRTAAAHAICSRVELLGEGIEAAAEAVINVDIPALGGNGGAIALGADGRMALPFNTEGMYRGWIGADGIPHVAIGRDDVEAMAPERVDR